MANEKADKLKALKLTLDKFFKKKFVRLPKNLLILSKLMNKHNLARKDCLMLPFVTVSKILNKL